MLEALQALEGTFLLWVQEAVRQPWLDPVVSVFTSMGDMGILWIALSVGMLCHRPTRRAGGLALLAMLLGMLCTNVTLKHLVARPRPWLDVAGLIPLVNESDPNSFPSGHTCAAFSAAAAWWRTLPKVWMKALAGALAVSMGLSRLYVGVHYPSDVLCGALVGLLCGWAACRLCRLWEDRRTL